MNNQLLINENNNSSKSINNKGVSQWFNYITERIINEIKYTMLNIQQLKWLILVIDYNLICSNLFTKEITDHLIKQFNNYVTLTQSNNNTIIVLFVHLFYLLMTKPIYTVIMNNKQTAKEINNIINKIKKDINKIIKSSFSEKEISVTYVNELLLIIDNNISIYRNCNNTNNVFNNLLEITNSKK